MYIDEYSSFWTQNDFHSNRKRWSIKKEKRVTCFGYPGYIIQWTNYGDYETMEEAEKEIAKIHAIDPLSNYQIIDNRFSEWIVK